MPAQPTSGSRRRRAKTAGLVVLLALVVTIAGAEWWVGATKLAGNRYAGQPLPPWSVLRPDQRREIEQRLETTGGRKALGRFDRELGWDNVPGKSQRKDVLVRINSLGARSPREFGAEPEPGHVRVACFGDSFVFGTDVADGEDWPNQLEALAPQQLEVVNMGVGAYGTDQTLLRFRRYGPDLNARVLLFGLFLENVARNVNRNRNLLYPQRSLPVVKPRFVLEGGELKLVPLPYHDKAEVYRAALDGRLVDALAEHEYWTDPRPLIPGSAILTWIAAQRANELRRWPRLLSDVDNEPAQVTLALTEALVREGRGAGAEHVLILVFPTRQQVAVLRREGSKSWQPLLDGLTARDVPFVDTSEWLKGAGQDVFGVAHLSAAGNAVIAEGVQRWLAERLD